MQFKITYTINVGQMEFIKPEIETTVEDYGSFEECKNHVFGIMDEIRAKYSIANKKPVPNQKPTVMLTSPAQLELLMGKAEFAYVGKLITEEEYDELKTNAHTYTTVRASSVIDQLKNKIDQANRDARNKQKKDNEITIDDVPF